MIDTFSAAMQAQSMLASGRHADAAAFIDDILARLAPADHARLPTAGGAARVERRAAVAPAGPH